MNGHWPTSGRSAVVLCILVALLTNIIPVGAMVFTTARSLSSGPRLGPQTYYVNASGLDTNDGSLAHPFREIRKAIPLVAPGDTVLVANGSYLGFNINGVNGNVNNWITFRAPDHNATITVTTDRSDNRDTIYIGFSSFIIIDGLRSFNANRAAMRIDQSNNITVTNVTFGNNAVWGLFTDFSDDTIVENSEIYGSVSQHGIYFSNSPDHPVARNNTIHDNAGCGIHMNGDISQGGDGLVQSALIEDNIIYNNGVLGGSGINMDGGQDSTIQNNILYNNHASGIANYHGDASSGPKNNLFYHNTIDMATDGRYDIQITDSVGPVKIRNNILYNRNPNHGGLAYGDANDIANTDSDYNIMDRMTPDGWNTLLTLAQWQAQGHEQYSFSAKPSELFVDVNARNYHLSSNSTAIDKGENLTEVKWDKDGAPRPSGNASDIGAYEYQVPGKPDITPPDPIIDLTAFNATHTTVDLSWTATGDDGKVGTPALYDLRYSKANIQDSNWASATKVAGLPKPLPAGTKQSVKVTGLTANTKYYFAIKATDKKNNTATLSNVASATTLKIIPDLSIKPSDIAFSNISPMEGDKVRVTATVHAINVTQKLSFFVELRADNVPVDNRSVSLNTSTIALQFNWTSVKGQHNISVVIDTAKAVQEANKTNNAATKAITVRAKPPPVVPDLYITASDIGLPEKQPMAGDRVQIAATVHAVNITHLLMFYAELLVDGATNGNVTVELNASLTTLQFNWTTVRGMHDVTVRLDTAKMIIETNETNNAATRNLEVSSPDLSISISDILFPGVTWYEGDVVPIKSTAHVVFLQPGTLVTVETRIDGVTKDNSTVKFDGASVTMQYNWTATPGAHNISIILDPGGFIDEANRTNNVATRPIVVKTKASAKVFDLAISPEDIVVDAVITSVKEGDTVPISVTIHAYNLTSVIDTTVELLIDYQSKEMRTVSMGTSTLTLKFNWTAVKGWHNITFKIEPAAGVIEPNKANNIATKQIYIAPGPGKHNNGSMVSPYLIIGVVVAAALAVLCGWFLFSRRRKRAKEQDMPEATDKGT